MRIADKVIMAMVALLGNPVKSASLLPHVTPHKLSQMLKESTVTHPTPQLQKTMIFYPNAALRDIPTDVSMTAAISNAYEIDDAARCRTCPSIDDDTSTPDPPFLQDWDDFRTTFLKGLEDLHNKLIIHSTGAPIVSTQATPNNIIVSAGYIVTSDPPAAAKPDRITFLKEADAQHNELFTPSKGASTVSTQDTHITDTIMPAGSIAAASDPPVAAEPDRISFLKESDAQHNSHPDSIPSAMKWCEVEPTQTKQKPDTTLAQLWIILAQLEDINRQFARWLETLTMAKPTTTPNNTPGNQMIPLVVPTVTTPEIMQSTPSQHQTQPAYIFIATHDNDPTGGMFLLLLPLDRHSPNVRPPPWPPPQ